jgi:hypothetical protein
MDTLSPYPGLRPFDVDESHLFFGREEQTDEVLQRLHATHFLGVVGPSGCGKSSLVRAGMIAALGAGFMVAAGSRWQFAIMRPESHPIHSLAKALVEQTLIGSQEADKQIAIGFLEATLRRGPLGVVEALRDTPLPADTNLLILVDQFEEIFRFEREGGSDEADAFVSLLLETARQREVPVYVVITMRSDFFGDCAIFEGLPEALNESQYLTPRLTREQRKDAIVGPARVFGGDVSPDLVNRLLNQMGTDPDQLPLMQHLLMRMWTWRFPLRKRGNGLGTTYTATELARAGRELTIADCDAVGGLEHALSRHADEAFEELDDRQKAIVETLFRLLSERAPGNRDIRRPTPAGEVAALAGASLDELVAVVEAFRAPGRSFLVPAFPEPIGADRVLDITHESLIRQWDRLREWADDEERSAEVYRRLAETASLWQQGKSALWQSPDLEVALDWRAREKPTALWAKRYGGDFPLAMAFLGESEQARTARELEAAVKLRRARLVAASASAFAVFLLVFGAWYYKAYVGEDVRYYKSFVKLFGEPVGIGELSLTQVQHRAKSLKFVRQGFLNPVLEMEAVDADGNCAPRNWVGTHLQDDQESDNTSPLHECRWDFVYDNKGQVVYEKAYDKEGQLRWGYSYTPGEEQTTSRTAYYVGRDGFPAHFKNSLAEIVRFDYSPKGYEIRETWMDRKEKPQPVKDRAYGREFKYDEQGRDTRMTSLDQQGNRMNDTAGNATLEMSYDQFGNETYARALDKDDKPVLFKDGYYEYRMTYDENGNQTSKAYFDLSSSPTVDEDGIHLYKWDYDEKGYVKEIRYYDIDGKPAVSRDGYHKEVTSERDERGRPLLWAYFGTADEPATDSNGGHEYRETYDSRGFLESSAVFDRDGRPTTLKQGYHKVEWQRDASGNKVWESYLDREGEPTPDVEGWYKVKLTYDDRNNLIEAANFDPTSRPVMTNKGYHRWKQEYNERGLRTEQEFFGYDGEKVTIKDGYHKVTVRYNDRGKQEEIAYFDVNDNRVASAEGFARMTSVYDGRDNVVESAYYGPDGRLTDRGKGYTINRVSYDEQDRVKVSAFYVDEKTLAKMSGAYAVLRRQYDGDLEDESYYDTADQAVTVDGCMTQRMTLDQRIGKAINITCLDAEGHAVRNTSGAAITTIKYDEHRREVEKAWYDENKKLVSSENCAVIRKKYDDHDNNVEASCLGKDGESRLGPDGYAILHSKYDDHNNEIEIAYFGEDGKPRIHPKFGYAIARAKYDERGNAIEFATYGETGELQLRPDKGYAIIRKNYDTRGNEIEEAYFGEDNKLRLGPDGYAIFRGEYDDHNRPIEEAYFGDDEKPRLHPRYGYALARAKYDEHGNAIEFATYGETGELRVRPDKGYAIIRKNYDIRGNEIEEAYFGEDEKLRLGPNGYAILRIKHDEHDNIIEKDYFSEDGQLRHTSSDYAIERVKYNDRGNEVEEAYFGPDGALTSAASFPVITRVTEIVVRDEMRRLKAQCLNDDIGDFWKSPKGCVDASGQPIVRHPVILEVFAGSRAQELGLRKGDVIEAYDGKPVFAVTDLVNLINQPGAVARRVSLVRQGHLLDFEAPPGRLGINIGLAFIAADQPESGEGARMYEPALNSR